MTVFARKGDRLPFPNAAHVATAGCVNRELFANKSASSKGDNVTVVFTSCFCCLQVTKEVSNRRFKKYYSLQNKTFVTV